jgi:hypothetical protein
METKKESFTPGFLRSLTGYTPFTWFYQPAKGAAGGILVGLNSDLYVAIVGSILDLSISIMVLDKKICLNWKLVVVYGSPYEDGKQAFLDEWYTVLASWREPTIIGGDFNLVRFTSDKSNGFINHRWADAFNDWVSKWGLTELDPPNKIFTWTNNQNNLIMAKIDRIFISTEWEAPCSQAMVRALEIPFPVITTLS